MQSPFPTLKQAGKLWGNMLVRAGTPGSKLNASQHQTGGQPWHGGLQSSGDAPPGVWDHDPANDFQMLNGTSIPMNSSEEEIYSYGMTCKSRLGIHLDDPPHSCTFWPCFGWRYLDTCLSKSDAREALWSPHFSVEMSPKI